MHRSLVDIMHPTVCVINTFGFAPQQTLLLLLSTIKAIRLWAQPTKISPRMLWRKSTERIFYYGSTRWKCISSRRSCGRMSIRTPAFTVVGSKKLRQKRWDISKWHIEDNQLVQVLEYKNGREVWVASQNLNHTQTTADKFILKRQFSIFSFTAVSIDEHLLAFQKLTDAASWYQTIAGQDLWKAFQVNMTRWSQQLMCRNRWPTQKFAELLD